MTEPAFRACGMTPDCGVTRPAVALEARPELGITHVLGIRWLTAQGLPPRSATDPALEILRQRYARGEINKEEFETKKRDLS